MTTRFRSNLYRGARVLGDIEAAERGPVSYGKRHVRRAVYAKTNGVVGRVLRAFRLFR